MSVFDYAKEIKEAMYKAAGVNASTNRICQMADFILNRQWNRKEFPKNEETVLIIVEHNYPGAAPHRNVLRAFYEDGTMLEEDSNYFWELDPVEDLNEAGEKVVPRGWYELSDYGEGSYLVTDGVVGWQRVPDPWEGEEKRDDADKAGTGKE